MAKNNYQQRFDYYVSRSVIRESQKSESRYVFWIVLLAAIAFAFVVILGSI